MKDLSKTEAIRHVLNGESVMAKLHTGWVRVIWNAFTCELRAASGQPISTLLFRLERDVEVSRQRRYYPPKPVPEHLEILANELIKNLEWDPSCEWGTVGTNPKRPLGNSDVHRDVARLLGLHLPDEKEDDNFDDMDDELYAYAQELFEALPNYFRDGWSKR